MIVYIFEHVPMEAGTILMTLPPTARLELIGHGSISPNASSTSGGALDPVFEFGLAKCATLLRAAT